MYLLENLLKLGFEISEKLIYSEFVYRGERPFASVKPSKYYLGSEPACYQVVITK